MPRFSTMSRDDAHTLGITYDGTYVNDETEHTHDTWLVESGNEDVLYCVDRCRVTGEIYCSCPAHDYGKNCWHKEDILRLLGLMVYDATFVQLR